MPIEMWWWMTPLLYTGYVTLIVFGIAAAIIDRIRPYNLASAIFGTLAVAPLGVFVASFVVWSMKNLMILIWRV